MVHHSNEEVKEDNNVDDREATEHDKTPEPGELLDTSKLKVIQVNQAKWSPK